jgi:hypothetical protein
VDEDAGGAGTMRAVTMEIGTTFDTNLTTREALFAMTASPDGAELFRGTYLAFSGVISIGTGQQFTKTTLVPSVATPQNNTLPIPCRGTGITDANGVSVSLNTMIGILPFYLWFGVRIIGSDSDQYIDSFTAFETR